MANTSVFAETRFREVIGQLRTNVAGTKAIVLIGPDGVILEHLAIDPFFDVETFTSEYATLLRIAHRTSEDMGSGSLTEHIAISDRTVTVARCFASEFYLILVSNIQDQIGRARYELKRAAFYLERTMHVRTR
jgi:predicted regulator of Ras-like GTPase activity (Roadblock/LC7/MglB family)